MDIERKNKLEHKAKILKPFSGGHPSATFTAPHETYHLEGEPYKQPKVDESGYRSKTSKKRAATKTNKTGHYGTFTKFPNYVEEGEKPKGPLTQ